jgi:hypothetical protein
MHYALVARQFKVDEISVRADAARAIEANAISPPAPGLFSTTNLAFPPTLFSTNGRSLWAITSVPPPAAKPITTSIGLSSG